MATSEAGSRTEIYVAREILQRRAESLTTPELRTLADGMPYRGQARKHELVEWLIQHRPSAIYGRGVE